jgi:hypothetical protein
MNPTISHARLLELVSYDPQTGIFTNRVTRAKRAKQGDVCGSKTGLGYIEMRIEGVRVLGHRLAWFYVHGEWPKHRIDHIDGDPSNNRLTNLRDVLHQTNMQNIALRNSTASGLAGAYPVGKRFKALIRLDGSSRHLGYFDTAEAAHAAYVAAKLKHHAGFTGRTR